MSRIVVAVLIPVLLTCPLICHAANAQELAAASTAGRGQAVIQTVHLCSCCQGERSVPPSSSSSSESDQRQGGTCLCKGCVLNASFKDAELTLDVADSWVGLLEMLPIAQPFSTSCDFVGESPHFSESGRALRLCLQSLLF